MPLTFASSHRKTSWTGVFDAMSIFPLLRRHANLVAAGAVAFTWAVAAILGAFAQSLPDSTAVLVLVLCVVAGASTGLRRAGLAAAVAAAVGYGFYFVPPFGAIGIDSEVDRLVFVLLLIVGVIVTELSAWARRQEARAVAESAWLDAVVNSALIAATLTERPNTPEWFLDYLEHQIRGVLGVERVRYEAVSPSRLATASVMTMDGTVTRAGRTLDVAREGLPVDCDLVLMTTSEKGGAPTSAFVAAASTAVVRPNLRRRRHAMTLASHMLALPDQRNDGPQPHPRPWPIRSGHPSPGA